MEWDKLAEILTKSIKLLIEYDSNLFVTETHQRTYCARLAHQLEPLLLSEKLDFEDRPPPPGYRVDVEYNRAYRDEENKTKRLFRPRSYNTGKITGESSVFPDLNVHRRGLDGPNLLVSEVVKLPDRVDEISVYNFWKLAGYVEYFDYQYGLYLCFATGTERPGTILEAWLLDGDKYGPRGDGVRRDKIDKLSLLSDMLHDTGKSEDERLNAKQTFISLRDSLGFRPLDKKSLRPLSA